MKLYTYFRSSAAYRVRIALNLKGINHEMVGVNLLKSEQISPAYLAVNPQGLLPALDTEHGQLSQSLAILVPDEIHPEVPLLPSDPWQKAQVRSMSYAVACDIHPIDNLRVLKYLTNELNVQTTKPIGIYTDPNGFEKLESQLGDSTYCCGEAPTLADICLIPWYLMHKFKLDMSQFPKMQIYQRCNDLPAFKDAPETSLMPFNNIFTI